MRIKQDILRKNETDPCDAPPVKITIFGVRYRIQLVDRIFSNGRTLHFQCDLGRKLIHVSTGSMSEIAERIGHAIIHLWEYKRLGLNTAYETPLKDGAA